MRVKGGHVSTLLSLEGRRRRRLKKRREREREREEDGARDETRDERGDVRLGPCIQIRSLRV